MTFTTWSALHTAMLDQAAEFFAGQGAQHAEYEVTIDGATRRLKYRTVAEFEAGLAFVARMAAAEKPLSTRPLGRIQARSRFNR